MALHQGRRKLKEKKKILLRCMKINSYTQVFFLGRTLNVIETRSLNDRYLAPVQRNNPGAYYININA